MYKKILLVIFMVFNILSLVGCNNKNRDAIKLKKEYEQYNGNNDYVDVNIDEDSRIKLISIRDSLDIINNDSGVIFFGMSDDAYSRAALPILLDASSNTSIDYIYYVDMRDKIEKFKLNSKGKVVVKNKGSSDYYDLVDRLKNILDNYTIEDNKGNLIDSGRKIVSVPMVINVNEGKILSYHKGTIDNNTRLNNQEIEQLYNIYLQGIYEVLGDI